VIAVDRALLMMLIATKFPGQKACDEAEAVRGSSRCFGEKALRHNCFDTVCPQRAGIEPRPAA
jgi:hypothetical protein